MTVPGHVMRTTGPEASVMQVAEAVIRETDPDIALTRVGSLAGSPHAYWARLSGLRLPVSERELD
jgi:hypothetical protein